MPPWEKYGGISQAAQTAPAGPWAKYAPLAQPRTFQNDADEALYQEQLSGERQRRAGPRVPMPEVPEAPTAELAAIQAVQQKRGEEAEQKAFDDSRTVPARAMDAAAFAASVIPRMATRGQYGAGDIAGLLSPGMGAAIAQREANFARANQPGLEAVKAAGDIAAGIPALSTMGAPLKGISATGTALANRPLPQSAVTRAMVRNERLADIDAFHSSGVKPFGPALTETGTAGVVKQLSEAPIVGAPVRNRLMQAIEQTRDAGERVAGKYGEARTYRDVGNVTQRGLDRFTDAKAADIGEEAAKNLPDEAIAKTISKPARETSIKTKQDALYERAWRGIPEDMAQGRSKKGQDRFLGAMTNTQALLKDLSSRNQRMYSTTRGSEPVDPRLSYPVRGGIAGQIVEDIIDGRWRGNLQTMRDVRSSFRRLASGLADTEKNTLQLSDFRRVQSAMTQDMIALLERNTGDYAKAGKVAEATKIQRAIHDFRRADQFTRASVQRLEALEKLYGSESAENLALSIVKDMQGGRKGGNVARLTALRRSLTDDEIGDISSGIIREMGRPMGSARGAAEEAGFSVQSFTTNWNNASKEAKGILFNGAKDGKALRAELDNFARVADRMANFEALTNTSRSATNAIGLTGLASIFTAAQQAMTGNFQTAAAAASVAGGTYAFGKFMTSPAYVRWLTRAAELSGDPGKFRSLRGHARELARLAEKEPDQAVQELMRSAATQLGQAVPGESQGQAQPTPQARQQPASQRP